MVVKIQNSYPSMRHTLNYNEDKVSAKEAERIAVFNIEQNDLKTIKETFDKYEKWNIRTEDVSFQMSINPNNEKGERLSDEKASELAYKLMSELGYEKQPIVVYRHEDIDRKHFHVVSIRTNELGKKIKDTWEIKRLQKALKSLEKEYGFIIGKQDVSLEKAVSYEDKTIKMEQLCNQSNKSLSSQYLDAFEKAKKYHFRTFTQFKAIMQWYGINVTKNEHDRSDILCFQKKDGNGRGCSPIMNQLELGKEMMSEMLARAEECKADTGRYLPQRRRMSDIISVCMDESSSIDELKKRLEKEKIGLLISRNKDGSIFGLTLVDHQSLMAFKGSEINKNLNPEFLKKLEAGEAKVGTDERRVQNTDAVSDHLSHVQTQHHDAASTIFEAAGALVEIITASSGSATSDAQRKSDSDAQRPRREKKKKYKY